MSRPKTQPDTCEVAGCNSAAYCRSMCKKHYSRVWRHGDVDAGTFARRFEERIDKSGECWIWTGSYSPSGYGRASRGLKKVRAHRAAYELYVGPITDGLHVLHKCDNPACVNPAHLFLGTHLDNMRDMETKGRAKWIQDNIRSAK